MITRKRIIIAGLILAASPLLAACGSYSSSHDNAAVNQEIKNGVTTTITTPGPVTRIDTPGYFPAMIRVCVGTEGLYVSESSTGIITAVPQDPGCGYKYPVTAGASTTTGPQKDSEGK